MLDTFPVSLIIATFYQIWDRFIHDLDNIYIQTICCLWLYLARIRNIHKKRLLFPLNFIKICSDHDPKWKFPRLASSIKAFQLSCAYKCNIYNNTNVSTLVWMCHFDYDYLSCGYSRQIYVKMDTLRIKSLTYQYSVNSFCTIL